MANVSPCYSLGYLNMFLNTSTNQMEARVLRMMLPRLDILEINPKGIRKQ